MEIVSGESYIKQIKEMIKTYTDTLARDLSFQDLDEELADPAAKYCPPAGEILVAVEGARFWEWWPITGIRMNAAK